MSSLCDVAAAIDDATESVRSHRAAVKLLHSVLVPSVPLDGYDVQLDPSSPDGTVQISKRMWTIRIGSRPLTEVERAGYEARHIVRSGLTDVLDWLGEDVGPAQPPTHDQLLAVLRGAR
jgi:hypothetical protein